MRNIKADFVGISGNVSKDNDDSKYESVPTREAFTQVKKALIFVYKIIMTLKVLLFQDLTTEEKETAKELVDFKYDVISALQNREWYNKDKFKLRK